MFSFLKPDNTEKLKLQQRIAELEAQVDALTEDNAEMKAELAQKSKSMIIKPKF